MKLVAVSAIATVLAAAPAVADDAMNTADDTYASTQKTNLIRTRDITGGAIYTYNEANDEGWDADAMYDRVDTDWNEIGEIEDIVLSSDGKMIGIVAEVGGFLDVADKHVMVKVDDINLVASSDNDYAFVTRLNEEDLEAMNGIDEGYWE